MSGETSFLLGAETVQAAICPQMVALSTDAMFRCSPHTPPQTPFSPQNCVEARAGSAA